MNISCSAEPCPILLDCSCVFYTGANLIYTGILTNDTLCTALTKIDNKFKDASVGYIFENGIIQFTPGAPVRLGGTLTQNTVITSGAYTFALTGTIESTAFITTGGTSSQFVKGDGSLDNTAYQPAGNYITALTGDGTATGPGSAAFTLASVNATFGTWGSATQVPVITTDVKGRITNITPVTITVPSGILSFIGDVTGTGLTGSATTLTLATVNSNVYTTDTPLIFSVNGKGLVTSAAPFTSATIQSILGFLPIGDAPSDGTTYGRKNGAWSAVTAGTGTVTSVAVTPGVGISASVANPTTTPNITITNTAPDQTVVLNNGTGISVTGTYPNFTITATGTSGVSSVTASTPLASSGGATPNITIQQASGSQDGYLSLGDWTTFNSKQNTITNPVTGTGTSTRVAFWDTGSSISSDADLYWDNTNKRLGIGTASPSKTLDVKGFARIGDSSTNNRGQLTVYPNDATEIGPSSGATGNAQLRVYGGTSNGDASIYFGYNQTYVGEIGTNGTAGRLVINPATELLFLIGGTEKARLANSGNLGIGTATPGYKLDVNGTGRFVNDLYADEDFIVNNYFAINTTATAFPIPNGNLGIWRRKGNGFGTYFLEDEQGGAKDKWAFVKRQGYNGLRDWYQTNSSIVNINYGWGDPNSSNYQGATLLIDPTINITNVLNTGTIVRGIYYNPTLTSLTNTTHIGFENTKGDNYLNSTSGFTAIKHPSTYTNPYNFDLDVNGKARIGNLSITTSTNAGDISGSGIRVAGIDSTFQFQGSSAFGNTMFTFSPWVSNTTKTALTNTDAGIIKVNGGFQTPNLPNLSGNTLWLTPSYDFPVTIPPSPIGTKVRGIYYDPSVGVMTNTTHIAFENTQGDIIHGNLAGGGTQMVTVDNTGKLGATTIPTGSSVGFEQNFLLMGA